MYYCTKLYNLMKINDFFQHKNDYFNNNETPKHVYYCQAILQEKYNNNIENI